MSPEDPFRADAAIVYRFLRAAGASTAESIAHECFPTTSEGPESSVRAIAKRSTRRVYDSLVWMRHHNAPIYAVPTPLGTIFSLVPVEIDPLKVRGSVSVRSDSQPVTGLIESQSESQSLGAQDLWHGK